MRRSIGKCAVPAAASLALVLAACRSGSSAPASPLPTPEPVPRSTPTPPPPAGWVPTQPPRTDRSPAVTEILDLARSGASEETLLAKVRAAPKPYELTSADVLALREAGVSEAVVQAMLRSGRR